MNTIEQLQNYFMKFPGVGRRQAQRFAYFIATQPASYRQQLIYAMNDTGNTVRECAISHQHFFDSTTDDLAPIERNPERSASQLMIVEKDVDIDAIEKSGEYKGKYFVLGRLLPVVKNSDEHTRIPELITLIEKRLSDGVLEEIIIALSVNPESEHTRLAIEEQLRPVTEKYPVHISRLGRGLSTGSELEYADSETVKAALESRR